MHSYFSDEIFYKKCLNSPIFVIWTKKLGGKISCECPFNVEQPSCKVFYLLCTLQRMGLQTFVNVYLTFHLNIHFSVEVIKWYGADRFCIFLGGKWNYRMRVRPVDYNLNWTSTCDLWTWTWRFQYQRTWTWRKRTWTWTCHYGTWLHLWSYSSVLTVWLISNSMNAMISQIWRFGDVDHDDLTMDFYGRLFSFHLTGTSLLTFRTIFKNWIIVND